MDSLHPWVLACIEAFGPKRIMFASHWPIDTLWGTHQQLFDAYAAIILAFTLDEQTDMLSRNALGFYRITQSGAPLPRR